MSAHLIPPRRASGPSARPAQAGENAESRGTLSPMGEGKDLYPILFPRERSASYFAFREEISAIDPARH